MNNVIIVLQMQLLREAAGSVLDTDEILTTELICSILNNGAAVSQ